MPAFGITAVGSIRPMVGGGKKPAFLYAVLKGDKEIFRGLAKDVSEEFGVNRKSVSHYVATGSRMKKLYNVVRVG